MNRREFMIYGSLMLATPYFTACERLVRPEGSTSKSQEFEKYYQDQGIIFTENGFRGGGREITVLNGSDMQFNAQNFMALYGYFDSSSFEAAPITYQLNESSGVSQIELTRRKWLEEGQIIIVPESAGVPDEFRSENAPNHGFTYLDNVNREFTTFLLVPKPEDMTTLAPNGISRTEYLFERSMVEACQSSIDVSLTQAFPNSQLPLEYQTLLAQEGFCNTFLGMTQRLRNNEAYSVNVYSGIRQLTLPGWGDQLVYDVPVTAEQYYNLPVAPYLSE